MWFGGNGPRTLRSPSGMTRAEITSAIEQIVAAVADESTGLWKGLAALFQTRSHSDFTSDAE